MCCIFKTTHSNTYKSGNDIKGYNVLFCFFYYRAAWWIQGRPRTRLWCQRWQEPRSNLLKDTQYRLLIELHRIKIFSSPRWTICHLLFLFFFFTCLGAFFTFPTDTSRFVLFFGGVRGLVSCLQNITQGTQNF